MTRAKQRRAGGKLEPIEGIIRQVFHDGRFGGSAHVAELWNRWKDIVGEAIAEHCFPEKISDGKLYIRADSPIWRQQLDLLKEEIKEKIDAGLDNQEIKALLFR